ncbi:MAG: aminoglycoside phosphotransferase family protein [Deltaproteobacteria bacterium]|nr:aminoglycoside phosphotransferase family protein [Deltaproteobacteria bacterium]
MDPERLREVAAAFEIPGRWVSSSRFGSGHINDTIVAVFDDGGRTTRWVQQRINRSVFADPVKLMENVARVTEHQRRALLREAVPDPERRALQLVPARGGGFAFVDSDGEYWRTWRFVEGASSRDVIRTRTDARRAAEAFGRFQTRLADLPGPRLHETIPRFHDARVRFESLVDAARADVRGRFDSCRAELDLVFAREAAVDRLLSLHDKGAVPERITHNDTKVNNVLFDEVTGEALCVIDLDTVMPGLALYDFGDLVRTAASPTAEDERDLSKVDLDPATFAALVEGYLAGAPFLTPAERAELTFSGLLMTLVVGIRFLTDHLRGDVYFRIHRPGHNLDRCRAQLRLVSSIERQRERLEAIVAAGAALSPDRSGP